MENMCNAMCLQYTYPDKGYCREQSNEMGVISNISHEGLPNCKEWHGVFSPYNGQQPVFVLIVDLDRQVCAELYRTVVNRERII